MDARLFRYDNTAHRLITFTRITLFALIAFGAMTLIACSAADSESDDTTEPSMGFGQTSAGEAGNRPDVEEAAMQDKDGSASYAGAPAGGGEGSAPIADVLGRAVIRNGSVDLTVESVSDSFEDVRQLVQRVGGYIAGSSLTGQEDSQRARMTLRVPADQFDQVVADLRGLAVEVGSVSTSSQDVTEEYTDLQASLRNYEAIERQYLTLLGEAGEIGEILQVQDRLSNVRYEIERVQGRLNLLDNLTSLATLEVSLRPESVPVAKVVSDSGFGDRVSEAWESSLETITAIGTGLAVAIVWSWWLIPIAIVALIVVRRYADRPGDRGGQPTPNIDTPEGAA